MNLAATSFVHEGTSSTYAHLVTYSTVVIIYLAPVRFPYFGNGPIKSIAQVSKVNLGLIGKRGISFFGSGRPNL